MQPTTTAPARDTAKPVTLRPTPPTPPTFEAATKLRHKAWAAGFDPNHWYAVEFASRVANGQAIEVVFQGASVALFRGMDGAFRAIENRCAHRQVKLSDGFVRDCALVCRYHGWTFDGDGKMVGIANDLADRKVVKARLRRYAVAVKYGLVFVFFGDAALAASRPLPVIPELDGDEPWLVVPIDYTMRCHPTAYINNIMDSTHVATLHTKFNTRSMLYGPVTRCEAVGDTVVIEHEIRLDPKGLLRHILGDFEHSTQQAYYDYPYLHVHVGGVTALWNFMLPVDLRTTRAFLLSLSKRPHIPGLRWPVPHWLMPPFLRLAKATLVQPLFDEDVWSTEAEQRGFDAHFDAPEIEPHPSIRHCYELTVRKWQAHLAAGG
jgi:phenylpropionate dioxygenase-like ring-hydroxylating dioxygenase large terminal subunit